MAQADKGSPPGRSEAGNRRASERQARLAEALRENLRRRKQQAAERRGSGKAAPPERKD